jgi:hypothetical protein
MTKRARWAFAKKEDAEGFVKEHGGEICTFDLAMQGTYEDMYADTKMIREKKKMKSLGGRPQDAHQHSDHAPKQRSARLVRCGFEASRSAPAVRSRAALP